MGELPSDLQRWTRFWPSNEKAIDILISKITGNCRGFDFIFEASKCNLEPCDLKNLCLAWLKLCGIEMQYPEWWSFLPPDRNGKGMIRSTQSGFWKVTGKPMEFRSDLGLIGKKEILVFHEGHGKKGKKTNWVMHQFHVTLKELDGTHPGQSPFVLCRLFYKQKESAVQYFKSAGLAFLCGLPALSGLPALEVQATTTPENFGKTISPTRTPVDCDGKSWSAHAAENQFGELTATKFQEGFGLSDLEKPLDCNFSSPLTSDMHVGMSSHVSNDYNHCGTYYHYGANELPNFGNECPDLTSDYLSKENFSNTFGCQKNLPSVSMKDDGSCSGSDAKMANTLFQEGFGLSDLQNPLDCNFSLPLTSDMHVGMSFYVSNGYNHCGTFSQNGRNELPNFGSKFSDLTSDDLSEENFPNTFGCEKNLPSVSMKDNGSCSALDAKLANTLFASTFQGSGETRKRKASSGLLNLEKLHQKKKSYTVSMGGSSNQIIGSDCILKNY